jgi:hypothetical protein
MVARVALGVGHAAAAREGAGAAAANAARDALAGAPARAALLFLPYRGAAHRKIAREVRDTLGSEIPIVGGTTYGEIVQGRPVEGEVVVALIGGEGVRASAALGPGVGGAPREITAQTAHAALAGLDGAEPRLSFVVYDPLAGDMRGVMEGLQGALGSSFPIIGAGSGTGDMSETRPLSLQLAGDRVVGGSIAVLAVGGDLFASTVGSYGARVLGGPFEVTRVAGTTLIELDGARALDVYSRAVGVSEMPSRESAEGEGREAQILRVTPAGAPPGSRSHLALYANDAEAGTLTLAVKLTPGDRVEVISVDAGVLRYGADERVEAAFGAMPSPPVGAIVSDCFGWKVTLRSAVGEELLPLSRALGAAPIVGMYSGGEIGNVASVGTPVFWFSNFLVSSVLIGPR